jgi:hypothetical protein
VATDRLNAPRPGNTISFEELQRELEKVAELRRVNTLLAWRVGTEGSFHPANLAPFVKSELNRLGLSGEFSLALCQRVYDYILCDAAPLEKHRLLKSV